MDARGDSSEKDKSEFLEMIKSIKDTHGISSEDAGRKMGQLESKILPAWQKNLRKILFYEHSHRLPLDERSSLEDIDSFIDALKTVHLITEDPETPRETRAILEYTFRIQIVSITVRFCNEKLKEELFKRRNEIPRESNLRRLFLSNYFYDLVYKRFYKERYGQIEARGENPGDYETAETQKEWIGHFDDLCREYGEEDLIDWQDDAGHFDDLPENLKEERAKMFSAHSRFKR